MPNYSLAEILQRLGAAPALIEEARTVGDLGVFWGSPRSAASLLDLAVRAGVDDTLILRSSLRCFEKAAQSTSLHAGLTRAAADHVRSFLGSGEPQDRGEPDDRGEPHDRIDAALESARRELRKAQREVTAGVTRDLRSVKLLSAAMRLMECVREPAGAPQVVALCHSLLQRTTRKAPGAELSTIVVETIAADVFLDACRRLGMAV